MMVVYLDVTSVELMVCLTADEMVALTAASLEAILDLTLVA